MLCVFVFLLLRLYSLSLSLSHTHSLWKKEEKYHRHPTEIHKFIISSHLENTSEPIVRSDRSSQTSYFFTKRPLYIEVTILFLKTLSLHFFITNSLDLEIFKYILTIFTSLWINNPTTEKYFEALMSNQQDSWSAQQRPIGQQFKYVFTTREEKTLSFFFILTTK